jgi:hypothetical protein
MKKVKTPKAPKQRKVREPKVKAPKMPGVKLGRTIDKLKKASAKTTLISGVALFFATILSKFFIDLPTTVVATWVYGALIGIFGFFFAISFILFLIWYLPRPAFALLVSGILVTVGLLLFVYPAIPSLNINETLQPLFSDVKGALKPVLEILDGLFA